MNRAAEPKSRIPEFSSIEEEAEFWDTHSTTEFEDEWEPVDVEFSRPLLHSLLVDFDGETFDRIVAAAKRRGIGPVALVHSWAIEALERDENAQRVSVRKSS